MTLAEAKQVTAMLATRFSVPAWSSAQLSLFASTIADLDAVIAKAVVMEIIRTWPSDKDAPSPADFRVAVLRKRAGDAAPLPPEDAWGFVVLCMLRVGQYRPFPNRYPLVERVVERMGWPELCRSDNQVADRAHFLQLYRALADRTLAEGAATDGARLVAPKDRLRVPQVGEIIGVDTPTTAPEAPGSPQRGED